MARPKKNGSKAEMFPGLNLRKLRKELKLIPFDIQREKRFMDMLFSERNTVRTQAEREVLNEMIGLATSKVESFQDRLNRFEECYRQFKERKSFDSTLLSSEELNSLVSRPETTRVLPERQDQERTLRTGTHG